MQPVLERGEVAGDDDRVGHARPVPKGPYAGAAKPAAIEWGADMKTTSAGWRQEVLAELKALRRAYAQVQQRCTSLVQAIHARNRALEAEVMRLRAKVIIRDTALAWAREGRPQAAGQTVAHLRPGIGPFAAASVALMPAFLASDQTEGDIPDLEERLVEADLVICQTGCLSHDAHWRVEDHCRRHNKPCVLVAEPDALRVVRIHQREQSVVSEASGQVFASASDAKQSGMLDTTKLQGMIENNHATTSDSRADTVTVRHADEGGLR